MTAKNKSVPVAKPIAACTPLLMPRGAASDTLLVHAGGEAFADQPGDDQHHALDAEGDHQATAAALA